MSMQRILNKKRAFSIIDNFSRSGVLVVGDIMADHFIWGRVSRISPEAPVPVVEVSRDNFMLGGCANVLNNIFAMGGRVYLASVIGDDETGMRLISEFRSRGMDTGGIVVEKDRPSPVLLTLNRMRCLDAVRGFIICSSMPWAMYAPVI